MSHLRLVHSAPPITPAAVATAAEPVCTAHGFTSPDLIALACWAQRSDVHGYRRVLIEGGSGEESPEEGGYVLIYAPGRDWASWGVARAGDRVTVWHCGTGSDLGRYDSMLQALDSLPPVRPAESVVPAAAARKPAARKAAKAPAIRLAWTRLDRSA